METPVAKPRVGVVADPLKKPVPAPRTRLPAQVISSSPDPRPTAADLLRSLGSVSKQLSEDVAARVTHSAKSANEKIERSFHDGSRFAKDTLEKTISTSRAVRDSVTKSVLEGTRAGLRLRRSKRGNSSDATEHRCVSMPPMDVSLFDNIQFHSPLLEQKRYRDEEDGVPNEDLPPLNLNASHLDDTSIFSSNSDSNTDSVSNFSYDSRESEQNTLSLISENDQLTYDTPKTSRTNSIVSSTSTPEVPLRRKKRESQLEIMRLNSMYENWTLPNQTASDDADRINSSRPSKSTIYEFDPLNQSSAANRFEGISNELLLLESFLKGEECAAGDGQEEYSYAFNEREYYNPPTPPERSDSLFPAESEPKASSANNNNKDRNSNWYIDTDEVADTEDTVKSNSSVKQKISSMLKLDIVLNKSVKQNGALRQESAVERPPVNQLPVPYFSGTLSRIHAGGVEDLFKSTGSRYCVLSDQKLTCYSDPTNSILKEAYPLESINSVQVVLPLSSSTSNNSYWLELSVCGGSGGGGESRPRRVVFGCSSAVERRAWAQRLAGHLTNAFPAKHTAEYTRLGWCYLKMGVSGEWEGVWLMLVRRALLYSTAGGMHTTLDLRKARSIGLQRDGASDDGAHSNVVRVDCCTDGGAVYLRWGGSGGGDGVMGGDGEAAKWRSVLRLAATNNGAALHHHQLTHRDVPVLVEKCMAFVCAHGCVSEGVYRRGGGAGAVGELLACLRRDAWAASLSPQQYSEHDVAAALKRFFRDLPEPLLPHSTHQPLIQAMDIEDASARHTQLRRILNTLGLVVRNTARVLFAHLHLVASLADRNKMTAGNLAAVWAPTLMPAPLTSSSLSEAWSAREVGVVRELIDQWAAVWRPGPAELQREAAVRSALLRAASEPLAAPRAGHLRLWIALHEPGNTMHIEVSAGKRAWDAVGEAAARAGAEPHCLALEERALGGALRRTLHPDELLLPTVLRWAYWDHQDRKDNYLCVVDIAPLRQTVLAAEAQASAGAGPVCGELRHAPPNTKILRAHHFELANGKLLYFKDKQGSVVGGEWSVPEMVWYWGHEPRRPVRARWAITFIPAQHHTNRSKDRPWFGHVLAGGVTAERTQWAAALWRALHPDNFAALPQPPLVVP